MEQVTFNVMAKREKVVKALDKIYCSKMVGVDGIL